MVRPKGLPTITRRQKLTPLQHSLARSSVDEVVYHLSATVSEGCKTLSTSLGEQPVKPRFNEPQTRSCATTKDQTGKNGGNLVALLTRLLHTSKEQSEWTEVQLLMAALLSGRNWSG